MGGVADLQNTIGWMVVWFAPKSEWSYNNDFLTLVIYLLCLHRNFMCLFGLFYLAYSVLFLLSSSPSIQLFSIIHCSPADHFLNLTSPDPVLTPLLPFLSPLPWLIDAIILSASIRVLSLFWRLVNSRLMIYQILITACWKPHSLSWCMVMMVP